MIDPGSLANLLYILKVNGTLPSTLENPKWMLSGFNGAINKILLITLKKRLEEAKEKWVDELFGVLWT